MVPRNINSKKRSNNKRQADINRNILEFRRRCAEVGIERTHPKTDNSSLGQLSFLSLIRCPVLYPLTCFSRHSPALGTNHL